MSEEWTKDVIYHLKREYPATIIVGQRSTASDTTSGQKTATESEFTIQKAIILPETTRQAFMRTIYQRKGGLVEQVTRDIYIDNDDVPTTQTLPDVNGYIRLNGQVSDILKVARYTRISVLTVKYLPGMPGF